MARGGSVGGEGWFVRPPPFVRVLPRRVWFSERERERSRGGACLGLGVTFRLVVLCLGRGGWGLGAWQAAFRTRCRTLSASTIEAGEHEVARLRAMLAEQLGALVQSRRDAIVELST